MSEVEDGSNTAEGEQRDVNNLYPLLVQHNGGRDSWNKGKDNANVVQSLTHKCQRNNLFFLCFQGAKDSAQQDKFTNMVRFIIYSLF